MKKTKFKKLTLNTETLRLLSGKAMTGVAGGRPRGDGCGTGPATNNSECNVCIGGGGGAANIVVITDTFYHC